MKKLHILLVDDDDISYESIKRLLSKEQFSLKWAATSDEAITLIENQNFDIYLFDYRLDKLDGLELYQQVKSKITYEKTSITKPVILLTGQSDLQIAIDTLHAGLSDLLQKDNLSKSSVERALNNANDKHELLRQIENHRLQLEQAYSELKQKNNEIQHFYQTVSHELKTPLTSTREFIAIINDGLAGSINDDQKEFLSIAKRNCDQMALFINDLLDISKLETGKFTIEQDRCDLNDLIKNAITTMSPLADKKSIQLQFDSPAEVIEAYVDEKRISQVIANLLGNALKFTQANGQATIGAEQNSNDGSVTITVADNGCGIADEHLSSIFTRLYQIKDEANYHERGLGLGLNICKEIVELHGGKIWVESTVGTGSKFSFTVPLSPDLIQKDGSAQL